MNLLQALLPVAHQNPNLWMRIRAFSSSDSSSLRKSVASLLNALYLKQGQTLVQNCGDSDAEKIVIELAEERKLQTICMIGDKTGSPETIEELMALGGVIVVLESYMKTGTAAYASSSYSWRFYCVHSERPFDSLVVFQQMRWANVEPYCVTLVSVLSSPSHLASLSIGRSMHSCITTNEIELDVALGTALVNMFAKCGCIEEAFQFFKSMEERNLQPWTIMISGFAVHGQRKEAITLFSQMEAGGLKPDSTSFSIILRACSHLGMVDEGQNYCLEDQ